MSVEAIVDRIVDESADGGRGHPGRRPTAGRRQRRCGRGGAPTARVAAALARGRAGARGRRRRGGVNAARLRRLERRAVLARRVGSTPPSSWPPRALDGHRRRRRSGALGRRRSARLAAEALTPGRRSIGRSAIRARDAAAIEDVVAATGGRLDLSDAAQLRRPGSSCGLPMGASRSTPRCRPASRGPRPARRGGRRVARPRAWLKACRCYDYGNARVAALRGSAARAGRPCGGWRSRTRRRVPRRRSSVSTTGDRSCATSVPWVGDPVAAAEAAIERHRARPARCPARLVRRSGAAPRRGARPVARPRAASWRSLRRRRAGETAETVGGHDHRRRAPRCRRRSDGSPGRVGRSRGRALVALGVVDPPDLRRSQAARRRRRQPAEAFEDGLDRARSTGPARPRSRAAARRRSSSAGLSATRPGRAPGRSSELRRRPARRRPGSSSATLTLGRLDAIAAAGRARPARDRSRSSATSPPSRPRRSGCGPRSPGCVGRLVDRAARPVSRPSRRLTWPASSS